MDVICAGRSLLLRETPHQKKPHLWFVLTDASGEPAEVVIVMVRSTRSFTDESVTLDVGDHPFVKHESAVQFSTARRFRVRRILRAMHIGHCNLKEDMSAELLARVREGLLRSPYTVHHISDYCRGRF